MPAALGLGVGRRTLGRRIKDDPDFPKIITIKGRLYVLKEDVDAYKARLIQHALGE
jgi:predicted DNA-binding transcriptional regulator AlpA